MIQQALSGMLTVMMAKFLLNDMPHMTFGNPGNPSSSPSSMTSDILSRSGLKPFEYHWFPTPEEPGKPRAYPYTRTKNVGPYSVQMTRTNGTCTIRLYEFLEGWKKKLRGIWTGMEVAECEAKFEKVAEVVKQVRF